MKLCIAMVVVHSFFCLCTWAQDRTCSELPYGDGEKVGFIVHYKWGFNADIGTVLFDTKEVIYKGMPSLHVYADVKTNSFFDRFYLLRNIYESKFSKDDLVPLWFHREAVEGEKYKASNEVDFTNGGKTVRTKVVKSTRPSVDTTVTNEDITRDLLNMIFYVRTMDLERLEKGGTQYFVGILDRNIIQIGVKVMRREVKKVSGVGKFNTIVVGLKMKSYKLGENAADNGLFSLSNSIDNEKESIYLWITDDKNRLPVYFTAPVAVGSINGRLTSYEGLKYPLASFVSE